MRYFSKLIALIVFAAAPTFLVGAPIVFTGSQGSLAATVKFDVSGTNLLITLANTSSSDVLLPADTLSSVFFDIAGNPTLTRVSATITSGSTTVNDSFPAGGDVGGEWAAIGGLSGAPGNASYGISSSGFGLFGPGDRFNTNDLDSPANPGGMNYGLLSQGDNIATGNSPILSTPFVKHSVDFVLSGLPIGFQLSSISNIFVQYGTDLDNEPSYNVHAPEPSAAALAGAAVIFMLRRRSVRI